MIPNAWNMPVLSIIGTAITRHMDRHAIRSIRGKPNCNGAFAQEGLTMRNRNLDATGPATLGLAVHGPVRRCITVGRHKSP